MDRRSLPLIHSSEHAPNSQSSKASRSFQMEAQLALNQLVFEADQRRPFHAKAHIGVSSMHEVSEHADEAQRLAQQLLSRLTRPGPSPTADHRETLPPLRAVPMSQPAAKPTLASAKRFAIQPTPQRKTMITEAVPQRKTMVTEAVPQGKTMVTEAVPQRVTMNAEVPAPERKTLETEEPPRRATVAEEPARQRKKTVAEVNPRSVVHHSPQKSRVRTNVPSGRSKPLQPLKQQFHSSPSPVRHVPLRPLPMTPPTAQLVETEAVERSIIITVWELERSKLLLRINKAIASYYSWLLDELEEEMMCAKDMLEEEEEHYWTIIWNKVVIKNSAFRLWQRDTLMTQEEAARSVIAENEAALVGAIPSLAGHDEFVFYETEHRARREIREAESLRMTMITTKSRLREAVIDEGNLRKWVETLEDEMFASQIINPLRALVVVNDEAMVLNKRETRERASIVAEFESESLYFDRYSTNLSDLCQDTRFWNEKRDIEYHENLRRLFSAASEEQTRQEMLNNFAAFMVAKGALLSKHSLSAVLDNEWIRRGLIHATERKAFSAVELAYLQVTHDAEADQQIRRREDAKVAVSSYDGRQLTVAAVEHNQSTRRGFLVLQEQRERSGLAFLLSSLEDTWEAAEAASVQPAEAEALVLHEDNRRNLVCLAEANERRVYIKLFSRELLHLFKEEELSLYSREHVRRTFISRDAHASWRILCDVITAENDDGRDRDALRFLENEQLRRALQTTESANENKVVAATGTLTESDDGHDALPSFVGCGSSEPVALVVHPLQVLLEEEFSLRRLQILNEEVERRSELIFECVEGEPSEADDLAKSLAESVSASALAQIEQEDRACLVLSLQVVGDDEERGRALVASAEMRVFEQFSLVASAQRKCIEQAASSEL